LGAAPGTIANDVNGNPVYVLLPIDPYGGANALQSPNLREVAEAILPHYKANENVVEFNVEYALTSHLTLTSLATYDDDTYYSTEDYNRFATVPNLFNDTNTPGLQGFNIPGAAPLMPGGVYCDPQLGCANTVVGQDLIEAKSRQVNEELRLQSSFTGPFNFSLGANYTYYHTDPKYYVFFNTLSAVAQAYGGPQSIGNNSTSYTQCTTSNNNFGVPVTITPSSSVGCTYIDPNPLSSINGQGHNYFQSDNPYTLNSYSVFGEAYYQVAPNLKVTIGARYTDDNKRFTPVPSQLLLNTNPLTGGTVDGGYPPSPDINQHWGAFTGRIAIDWTPKLSFTDRTLIYASYNRGYKGGGANPPFPGFSTAVPPGSVAPPIVLQPYPSTFLPEYVNAFEVGTKNTLGGGRLVINADAFFYSYDNYQVSQIEDDSAVNQNFNAKVWGAELESIWQPVRQLRFDVNLGYEDSSIGGGDNAANTIDVANRTQGNPNYLVARPFPLIPDNCVMSTAYAAQVLAWEQANGFGGPNTGSIGALGCPGWSVTSLFQQFLGFPIPTAADEPNNGQGFFANVQGHNLPNQPHWTQSVGAQWTQPLGDEWAAIFRVDVYHQSSSWARVYHDPIDRLAGWTNLNLRLTLANLQAGLRIEAYVTNLLNNTPVTGSFLNSDNTGLTSNVFTLDPRVFGVSVTKKF
jgi:outer membrane receptor protein involved in Fe transport